MVTAVKQVKQTKTKLFDKSEQQFNDCGEQTQNEILLYQFLGEKKKIVPICKELKITQVDLIKTVDYLVYISYFKKKINIDKTNHPKTYDEDQPIHLKVLQALTIYDEPFGETSDNIATLTQMISEVLLEEKPKEQNPRKYKEQPPQQEQSIIKQTTIEQETKINQQQPDILIMQEKIADLLINLFSFPVK